MQTIILIGLTIFGLASAMCVSVALDWKFRHAILTADYDKDR